MPTQYNQFGHCLLNIISLASAYTHIIFRPVPTQYNHFGQCLLNAIVRPVPTQYNQFGQCLQSKQCNPIDSGNNYRKYIQLLFNQSKLCLTSNNYEESKRKAKILPKIYQNLVKTGHYVRDLASFCH